MVWSDPNKWFGLYLAYVTLLKSFYFVGRFLLQNLHRWSHVVLSRGGIEAFRLVEVQPTSWQFRLVRRIAFSSSATVWLLQESPRPLQNSRLQVWVGAWRGWDLRWIQGSVQPCQHGRSGADSQASIQSVCGIRDDGMPWESWLRCVGLERRQDVPLLVAWPFDGHIVHQLPRDRTLFC